jgi:hypothetical protein
MGDWRGQGSEKVGTEKTTNTETNGKTCLLLNHHLLAEDFVIETIEIIMIGSSRDISSNFAVN